jgi:hypothetical protein
MDANEYALKVHASGEESGRAVEPRGNGWARGSGQSRACWSRSSWPSRPDQPEPERSRSQASSHCQQKTKAAAKEKIIEVTPEPIAPPHPSPPQIEEQVFSLAAEPEPVAPTEPEPATAAPAPVIDVPVEMRGEDIFMQQGDRVTASAA